MKPFARSAVLLSSPDAAAAQGALISSADERGHRLTANHKAPSLLALHLRKFTQHTGALLAVLYLAFLGVAAIGAPALSALLGVTPTDQNVLNRFAPPGQKVEASASQKEQGLEAWLGADPSRTALLATLAKAQGWIGADVAEEDVPYELLGKAQEDRGVLETWRGSLASASPGAGDAATAVTAESQEAFAGFASLFVSFEARHLLGTDELGRDVFARLLHGARVSLGVALLVGLFAGGIGLAVGIASGYFGGWVDTVLMRLTDALLTIPTLPLYVILAAVDLSKLPGMSVVLSGESQSMPKLVIIMASLTWMPIARVARGAVLPLRHSEYVVAARSLGAGSGRVMLLHVLPNVLAPVTVSISLRMGEAMLIEAGLSFLGLGIQPPQPSWGNMLQNAMELVRSQPLLAILPGLLVFSVVIAVNFMGDGLRDAMDPRALKR